MAINDASTRPEVQIFVGRKQLGTAVIVGASQFDDCHIAPGDRRDEAMLGGVTQPVGDQPRRLDYGGGGNEELVSGTRLDDIDACCVIAVAVIGGGE